MPTVCTDEQRVSMTGAAFGPVPRRPCSFSDQVLGTWTSSTSPGRSSTASLAQATSHHHPGPIPVDDQGTFMREGKRRLHRDSRHPQEARPRLVAERTGISREQRRYNERARWGVLARPARANLDLARPLIAESAPDRRRDLGLGRVGGLRADGATPWASTASRLAWSKTAQASIKPMRLNTMSATTIAGGTSTASSTVIWPPRPPRAIAERLTAHLPTSSGLP